MSSETPRGMSRITPVDSTVPECDVQRPSDHVTVNVIIEVDENAFAGRPPMNRLPWRTRTWHFEASSPPAGEIAVPPEVEKKEQ